MADGRPVDCPERGWGDAPAGDRVLRSGWGSMASRKRSMGGPTTRRYGLESLCPLLPGVDEGRQRAEPGNTQAAKKRPQPRLRALFTKAALILVFIASAHAIIKTRVGPTQYRLRAGILESTPRARGCDLGMIESHCSQRVTWMLCSPRLNRAACGRPARWCRAFLQNGAALSIQTPRKGPR